VYKSIVKEIGVLVPSFEADKVVILFGPQAPQELKEIAVIHESEVDSSEVPIKEGGSLQIDDQQFTITAVGSAANKNLKELGHISIYFSEPSEQVLPGAIFASPYVFPQFKNGSTIELKG
jgi:PTS system glucitol/sorbitol-specific IIA component